MAETEQVLDKLDTVMRMEADSDAWDMPPQAWIVTDDDSGGVALNTWMLAIPDADIPAALYRALAECLSNDKAVYAMSLTRELWTVRLGRPASDEERREIHQLIRARRLQEHPARVEVRLVLACDVYGGQHLRFTERGLPSVDLDLNEQFAQFVQTAPQVVQGMRLLSVLMKKAAQARAASSN